MKRPFVLGLTGSIGMGKSTTAAIFAEAGVPVWDADAAVHRLYRRGGDAVAPLGELCPQAVIEGGIDRAVLKRCLRDDPDLLTRIERVVHPLLARDRQAFITDAEERGEPLVVLDMPLLFETGGEAGVDAVLVVTAPPETQRARVLERPGMTETQFESLLARQVPDAQKRARADHVIETVSLEQTRAEVGELIARLRNKADA